MTEGTVILVSQPKKGLYNRILPPLIRWFTDCEYHHVAVVGRRKEDNNNLWVYEAVFKGFKPTYPIGMYYHRAKEKNIKTIEITPNVDIATFRERLYEIQGSPYDFKSLLFYQVVFQLTRKLFGKGLWLGKRGPGAKNRTYCSEAIAYILGHENWETWTARDFINYYER